MKYESTILKRLIDTYGVVGNPRYISEIIKEFIVRGKERFPELFTYQADWLAHIDEFGLTPEYTVSYTGQHIYAPNTKERPVKSAILKGQTLNNITKSRTSDFSISDTKWWYYSDTNMTMRNNEKYLIKFNTVGGTNINYNEFRLLLRGTSSNQYYPLSGGDNGTIITVSSGDCNEIRFNMSQKGFDSGMTIIINNVMVIPYQDGMENWDIPYFEGMKSVQMPDLTTCGKNLFDMNRPYDVITDSQATVVQDTNKITVSSANSGTYVNANFILDKDFFAGKTVTGSCLYESDIKDIGTVQINYQDGNGNKHYQSIKTPKSFTFPNDFVGDVLLCIYVNNTGTPQSNIVTVKNIQLELGSTATSYEPHKSNILTVNEPVELCGIGDVQDTLDCLTGEVTERIGEIKLDGSENWIEWRNSDTSYGFALKFYKTNHKPSGKIITNDLPYISYHNAYDGLLDKGISLYTGDDSSSYSIFIRLPKTECNGLDDFKSKLSNSPKLVNYQLATESIKTVALTIKDHNGQSVDHLKSFNGGTYVYTSSLDGSLVPSVDISVETDLEETLKMCSLDGNTM